MAEAQTYLSKCISQKRSIYSNRTVSYMIVLLELLTVLLEYIDLFVIAILISKNSYYYTIILPIMLALCSMLSDTYYAHNYASIIGGSLIDSPQYSSLLIPIVMTKLPNDLHLLIDCETDREVCEIDDLLGVIKKEVEARDASEFVTLHKVIFKVLIQPLWLPLCSPMDPQ